MARRFAFVAVPALVFLGLILALNTDFFRSAADMAPNERPVVIVKARVLDSFHRYIEENGFYGRKTVTGLNRREKLLKLETDDEGVDYIVARAGDSYVDDPGGVIISYDHPDCPLILPAGRQFKFGFNGGLIEEIEAILPLETMPWDVMQAELKKLMTLLDTGGWTRSAGYFTPNQPVKDVITFEDFLNKTGPKWASVGYWAQCDNPDIKLYLQIRHYNSSSSGSFIPPAVLTEPLDPEAEDTFLFLIRIEVQTDTRTQQEMVALRDARRLEETEQTEDRMPLAVWLDDPDWRPYDWDGESIK